MTDFSRIESYYRNFDEWGRLDSPEGKLEFSIVMDILAPRLSRGSVVFDLGGGPGRYTIELAKLGHKLFLGDLSPKLIETAREKAKLAGVMGDIESMEVVNALDLSKYRENSFDALLLFGPLYHLTGAGEIETCLSQVHRVLKKDGHVFGTYMPWVVGVQSIIDRSFYAPGQVDQKILERTFHDGVFNNASDSGFQEGMFLKTAALKSHFENAGFSELEIRSIRSVGYGREKAILELKETDESRFDAIMDIMAKMSADPSVIESCGHALYIGKKNC
jgi:ubiquinone/menaquinone biosynthesis C-methylase UbiE